MKPFWGFVKKEFYHILRDKRTLTVILGIPIVEMLLFGFVLTNEIKEVNVAEVLPIFQPRVIQI